MNIVPQLFYDLIARVIPSCVSIITVVFSLLWPFTVARFRHNLEWLLGGEIDFTTLFSFWGLAIFVTLAYVLGMILKLPSEWFASQRMIKKAFGVRKQNAKPQSMLVEINNVIQSISKNPNAPTLEEITFPEISTIYGIVRILFPGEGARLLKLLAEMRMCEMLFTTFFFAFIANLVAALLEPKLNFDRLCLSAMFLFSAASLIHLRYTVERFFNESAQKAWIALIIDNKKERSS